METTTEIETELIEAGGCRRRLSVTVALGHVTREFEEALHRYARAARIPGFRRGKVPSALVKKRFAHEIEEEVREHLVRHGLRAGFEKHKVLPLHNPVVDGVEAKDGEQYVFSALFEVRPEVRLGEYRGLPAPLPEPTIEEADIDGLVDSIRERLGKFVPVDPRPIAKGDFVLLDLDGRFESGKGKDFQHSGIMIELGAENNLPEFEAALTGSTVGDIRSFPVAYSPNFEAQQLAGRTVEYTVTIKEIKIKDLPPADDELPKDMGKEGTLADLREEIRQDLLTARRLQNERQAREAILRNLIETHPLEVPEVMVEDQVNLQLEAIVREMIKNGINPSKADVDWNELREKEIPLARQRVAGTLILDTIGVKEGIEVTDAELHERMVEEARRRGEKLAAVTKSLADANVKQALKNQLVREKSLDFLLKNATIKA